MGASDSALWPDKGSPAEIIERFRGRPLLPAYITIEGLFHHSFSGAVSSAAMDERMWPGYEMEVTREWVTFRDTSTSQLDQFYKVCEDVLVSEFADAAEVVSWGYALAKLRRQHVQDKG